MKFQHLRHVVTPDDLQRLKCHKFDWRGKGIIHKFIDSVAEKFLIPRIPEGVSPLRIICIGFIFHLAGALLLICNDNGSYAYIVSNFKSLLFMVGLFVYGISDSVGLAQSRRVGEKYILAELLSQGLSAFSIGLITLSVGSLLRLNHPALILIAFSVIGNFLFVVTRWRAYALGHLRLSKIDAIEGHCFVQLIFLSEVFLGIEFFSLDVSNPSAIIHSFTPRLLEVKHILVIFLAVLVAFMLLQHLHEIFIVVGQSSRTGVPTCSPMLWLWFAMELLYMNCRDMSFFAEDYMTQFLMVTVIVPLVKLSWVLIICYMCRSPVPQVDTCLLPSLLMAIWFYCLRKGHFMSYITRPFYIFNFLCAASICDLVYFALSNIYIINRVSMCKEEAHLHGGKDDLQHV